MEQSRIDLTQAEWQVMECLWKQAPRTGREAAEYMARRTGWSLLGWMPTGLAAGAALVSGVWLGGLLLGTGAALPAASPAMARVFDPVPPGGLCAAAEICRLPRTLP